MTKKKDVHDMAQAAYLAYAQHSERLFRRALSDTESMTVVTPDQMQPGDLIFRVSTDTHHGKTMIRLAEEGSLFQTYFDSDDSRLFTVVKAHPKTVDLGLVIRSAHFGILPSDLMRAVDDLAEGVAAWPRERTGKNTVWMRLGNITEIMDRIQRDRIWRKSEELREAWADAQFASNEAAEREEREEEERMDDLARVAVALNDALGVRVFMMDTWGEFIDYSGDEDLIIALAAAKKRLGDIDNSTYLKIRKIIKDANNQR